ncbi:MAG: TolC family protein [Phycisphaerae bacterium]|nr:TolC family protein [Phycisphaerae bacterium]MDZ4831641.1 TolC family protein [Phycisphaerae bacterium]
MRTPPRQRHRQRHLALFVITAAGLWVGGCAGMKPGMGFDDVQRCVSERTGQKVHWDNGSPEDEEARAAVRGLLASELSADGAVQIALLNNRNLQAVYEDLNLAQADLVQAGLLKNPVLSGEVRFATAGGGTDVVLDLSQDFVSLLSMPLRKGRAQAQFEAAKVRVTGAVLDLASETRVAYNELQAAEQRRELRGTVAEGMAASYEFAKRLRAAGNTRELDLFNERARYEQSKLDLAASEADVVQLRETMNELMGLWGDSVGWRIAGRLPPIPADEIPSEGLEARAVERSGDLELARREVEVAARTLGIAKPFALLQELNTGVASERDFDGSWSVGPSWSLPIPLFDQGQGEIGTANARLRQAAQHYYATAVALRARVRAAHAAVLSARDRALYVEKVMLPLREKIVDESQLHYNAMQVSAFQLLQAKRDQVEGGVLYVESLRGYWLARAKLELILSGRMPPMSQPTRDSNMNTGASSGNSRAGGH